ncbi:MAG TPA: hypothetical protein VIM99_09115 [Blastocatellia bacterium]
MALMLWLQLILALTGVMLFLAWVITGRRHQFLLRLLGVCGVIMGILFVLRAGR